MRKMEKPEVLAKDVFNACIENARVATRTRLKTIELDIEEGAIDYDIKASNTELYLITPMNSVGDVSSRELKAVYERMYNPDWTCRIIYDRLVGSAPNGICPLCGHREADTLDHYLPKSYYPLFVVTPFNLIPCCGKCNKIKLDMVFDSQEELILHPYYDDVDEEVWLYAEVIERRPGIVEFIVNPPDEWENVLKLRIQKHFDVLKLNEFYQLRATNRISNMRGRLRGLLEGGGHEIVSLHLKEEADSCFANHKNSWETALFKALSSSEWFCRGGFNL